jgi:hypothetical protein
MKDGGKYSSSLRWRQMHLPMPAIGFVMNRAGFPAQRQDTAR